MPGLPAGEFARTHQPIALKHAARNREHEPEREIRGRLGRDRRYHGDGYTTRRSFGPVDVRRRNGLRRDMTQLRIGGEDPPANLSLHPPKQHTALPTPAP